ncbi:hypothetical protein [Aquibacillus sediminis]|uniref:hypothetical protein n=1 Tax=Aquibacillus sediminis TaxID=2574734 RepID=UPI0014861578|nr:hypothetical protein [Aquibacillus sediminis]
MRGKVIWYEPLTEIKLYEGEAEDGKEHGSGKLYYAFGSVDDPENPPLRYEGDFCNGEIHGFGTMYSRDGQKMYEGEWKDGNYHGSGKLFSEEGTLQFEGEFHHGIKNLS